MHGRLFFLMGLMGCAVTACTPATTQSEFISHFTPSFGHLAQYESANQMNYTPRVKAHGLNAVNDAVNAQPYLADSDEKHLLNAQKFWTAGGDCEEYALFKMLELRAQGIDNLYYMVLVDGPEDENHAVLVAEYQGDMVVLDNQSPTLEPLSQILKEYRPAYIISTKTNRLWRPKVNPFK